MVRSLLAALFTIAVSGCGGEPNEASTDQGDALLELNASGPFVFEGLWANATTDCALEPGSSEDAPIQLTSKNFVGYENSCLLTSVREGAAGTNFDVQRQCDAEGTTYSDDVTFRLADNILMMKTDIGSVSWTRCEPLNAGE